MPKNELRHLSKLECASRETFPSMKALREFSNVKDPQTCTKCSKKGIGKFKEDDKKGKGTPRVDGT